MNERINGIIVRVLATALILSVVVVAPLPAVLAWWDQTPYWLLLYFTYPMAFFAIAAIFGNAKSEKANEEKRRNSNEYS